MNDKKIETEEILSAIREMMGEDSNSVSKSLPKDILDLTKKVDELNENGKKIIIEDVLELTNLVTEKLEYSSFNNIESNLPDEKNISIKDEDLKKIIRDNIEINFSSKIDLMIKHEIDKIINEKLNSIKIDFKENIKK